MLPASIKAFTQPSKSSQERKSGGNPERGTRLKIFTRTEERPVSDPAQNGELAERATKSGTWPERVFTARIASSASGTATWTCSPKMACIRAVHPISFFTLR